MVLRQNNSTDYLYRSCSPEVLTFPYTPVTFGQSQTLVSRTGLKSSARHKKTPSEAIVRFHSSIPLPKLNSALVIMEMDRDGKADQSVETKTDKGTSSTAPSRSIGRSQVLLLCPTGGCPSSGSHRRQISRNQGYVLAPPPSRNKRVEKKKYEMKDGRPDSFPPGSPNSNPESARIGHSDTKISRSALIRESGKKNKNKKITQTGSSLSRAFSARGGGSGGLHL